MYKNLFLILTLLFVFSQSIICQWVELNTIPNQTIKKFNFINDNIGYALVLDVSTNKELILKTIDGGNQWDSIPCIKVKLHVFKAFAIVWVYSSIC